MNKSEQINELAAAMAKAQGDIEGAVKDKSNPAFRSKYADLGAVWDAVRAPLAKNGLAVVQFPRRVENGIEVETILMHASGQWLSETLAFPVSKPDAHGHGSAITYARRFALSAVCGVAPVDDDGNAATGRVGGALGAQNNAMEEARRDIIAQNGGETRSVYEMGKSATGGRTAKQWADEAIILLNGDPDAVTEWWPNNKEALESLQEKAEKQYDRVVIAADNAREIIRNRAA